jgi:hypothetical protein
MFAIFKLFMHISKGNLSVVLKMTRILVSMCTYAPRGLFVDLFIICKVPSLYLVKDFYNFWHMKPKIYLTKSNKIEETLECEDIFVLWTHFYFVFVFVFSFYVTCFCSNEHAIYFAINNCFV